MTRKIDPPGKPQRHSGKCPARLLRAQPHFVIISTIAAAILPLFRRGSVPRGSGITEIRPIRSAQHPFWLMARGNGLDALVATARIQLERPNLSHLSPKRKRGMVFSI
jgi:hypothetical protein